MFKVVIFVLVVTALAEATYDVIEDIEGHQYYAVPVTHLHRERRQSNYGVSVEAQHTQRFGTDLSATGRANIWRNSNGNAKLDAVGRYIRHFGGPIGTGRPNYYGGLQFSGRF